MHINNRQNGAHVGPTISNTLPVPLHPVCKAKICGLLKDAIGMNIKQHRIIGWLINESFEGSDRDLLEHGIYLKGLRKTTGTENLRIAGTPT